MNPVLTTVAAAIVAYLLGSISFAIVVSKLFRLDDPRTFGSGNPGATNVLRTGNKLAAVLTLLGDCVKGWIPVGLVLQFDDRLGLGDAGIALVAIAVFAGHLWPLFFRFKGGKGVATLVTWVVVAYAFRYSSLAALIAAVFAPFYYGLLFGPDAKLAAVALMSVLLIYRHRKNIGKLLSGKESRIGKKAS